MREEERQRDRHRDRHREVCTGRLADRQAVPPEDRDVEGGGERGCGGRRRRSGETPPRRDGERHRERLTNTEKPNQTKISD